MSINDLNRRDKKFGTFEQAVALGGVTGWNSLFSLGINDDVDNASEEQLVDWGVYTFQDKKAP